MKDRTTTTAAAAVPSESGSVVISSSDALVRARDRVGDALAAQIWGLHVRARAVTQFIGETSAGKTVFLHNLAYSLATGKAFLGITPPRPCRVLHLDFETYDDLLAEHLEAIGTAEGWDFLDLEKVENVPRGPEFLNMIEQRTRDDYDVVIIDPLMEAYPVKDENDNALAEIQMQAFRGLARKTGAAVVLAHNSGLRSSRKTPKGKEGVAESKFLGRGATNRVDRADVSINFTAPRDRERLLYVAKSRAKNFGDSIRVRFEGEYGYAVIESVVPNEQGVEQGVIARTVADVLGVAREEAARGRSVVGRKRFLELLNVHDRKGEQRVDRALKRAVERQHNLIRVAEGVYSLAPIKTLSVEDLTDVHTDPALVAEPTR